MSHDYNKTFEKTDQELMILPSSFFARLNKAMSPAQLRSLSPSQANAVPQAVYETMNADQMAALDSKATLMFIKAAPGSETGGEGGGKDGT